MMETVKPRQLPAQFVEACRASLGDDADALLRALATTRASRSVRLNPAKPSAYNPAGRGVEWCDTGVRLEPDAPSVTLDPLFHAGAYYAQDASSMVLKTVVARLVADEPVVLVDACAAPGGKTTAAIDSLPPGSVAIANEIIPSRCAILRENLTKWGYPATIITRGDTASLARMGQVADIVIADVPCSGEGMMRKDDEAVAQWSPRLVEECVERQREIIDNLWPMLRPGGWLVYSTCTFNRAEDELMLQYIIEELGGEPQPVDGLPECIAAGIDTPYPCYRFMPHKLEGEGLFVGVVRKPGSSAPHASAPAERNSRRKSRQKNSVHNSPATDEVRRWIARHDEYDFITEDDTVSAFPRQWMWLLERVKKATKVVQAGVEIAVMKGRDIIPSHALAVSTILEPGAFTTVDLSREQALDYLRRNTLTLPSDTPRGYVIVTYAGVPLGFMKHLGSRSNNLYPADYRIKFL